MTDIDPLIRGFFHAQDALTAAASNNAGTIIWQIVLQIVLIALNAVFACAEIAVLSVSDAKLAILVESGNKRAKRLAKLTKQPARFLATIQVAITLAGFLASAFAAENFAQYIKQLIPNIPESLCIIVITILLSYVTLVFGELVPKRVAMKKSESLALSISGLLNFVSTIFAPLVWLLTVSTNGVLRLMHIDPNGDDEEVTEEEIRMMVDAGGEKGTIDRSEQEIIQNVFEFDDLTAGEIATHRTDIVILWEEDDDKEWAKTIYEHRYSQFPVCGESVDDVIGILNSKDYFRLADRSRKNVMENAVRAPYFVPEAVKADVLFRDMQHSRRGFVVVLDEYGGMSGILTMNDLVEQLVGDLDDEDDVIETEEDIVHLPDGNWRIRGSALIEDVAEQLNIKLPCDEYDTFGGYVFATLGRIADDGTTFSIETDIMNIDVLEIRDHRIETTVVRLKEQPKGDDSDSDKD